VLEYYTNYLHKNPDFALNLSAVIFIMNTVTAYTNCIPYTHRQHYIPTFILWTKLDLQYDEEQLAERIQFLYTVAVSSTFGPFTQILHQQ